MATVSSVLGSSSLASTASSSSSSSSSSKESGLEAFMAYAKETPGERIFDSWLSSQHITMDQYNAMTPSEKQKIMDEFESYEKQKLNNAFGATSNSSSATASGAVSS